MPLSGWLLHCCAPEKPIMQVLLFMLYQSRASRLRCISGQPTPVVSVLHIIGRVYPPVHEISSPPSVCLRGSLASTAAGGGSNGVKVAAVAAVEMC